MLSCTQIAGSSLAGSSVRDLGAGAHSRNSLLQPDQVHEYFEKTISVPCLCLWSPGPDIKTVFSVAAGLATAPRLVIKLMLVQTLR